MRDRFLVIAALLLAVPWNAPQAGAAMMTSAEFAPRFRAASCPFSPPSGQVQGKTVQCGYITVPERHQDPQGKTIELAVTIYKSASSDSKQIPIIYLQGGPGGSTRYRTENFTGAAKLLTSNQDVVFLDQRGSGNSVPALSCPELLYASFREVGMLDMSDDERKNVVSIATSSCYSRLLQMGVDISAYTTEQAAADIDDVRIALGYEVIDILAVGYSTRVAMQVARVRAEILHGLILDGVMPPDSNYIEDVANNADIALSQFFAFCAADEGCNAVHPNLPNDFAKAYTRL